MLFISLELEISMDSSLFIIHYFLNPILYYLLYRFVLGSVKYLTFPSIFFVVYFVTIYIQALNIYVYEIHEFYYLLTVWILPYLFIAIVGLVYLGLNYSKKNIRVNFYSFYVSKQDIIFLNKIFPYFSAFFIILPFVYIFDKGFKNISFFNMLINSGDYINSMYLRSQGFNSNISGILTIIYSYSNTLFYLLYITLLFLYYSKDKISKKHFLLGVSATILFALFTSAKAPIAYVLLALLFSYILSNQSKMFSLKLFIPMVGIFILPSFLYPLLYNTHKNFVGFALENLWRRVTFVPSYTVALYFDLFTNQIAHVGFSSNRFLAILAGTDFHSTASLVYTNYFYKPHAPVGLVNSAFFASFYADWGFIGVFMGIISVGLLLGILQVFYGSAKNDIVNISFKSVSLVATVQLLLTDFYSVALGRGLLLLAIIYFFISYGKIKKTNMFKFPNIQQRKILS